MTRAANVPSVTLLRWLRLLSVEMQSDVIVQLQNHGEFQTSAVERHIFPPLSNNIKLITVTCHVTLKNSYKEPERDKFDL